MWSVARKLTGTVSIGACVLTIALWIASYQYTFYLVGTWGDTHHQLIAVRGDLFWWRNFKWYRVENWGIVLDPILDKAAPPRSIMEWPGIRLETHTRSLVLESATGRWIGPRTVIISENDTILGGLRIEPGTVYVSNTQFQLFGIPLCIPLFLAGIFPVSQLFRWMSTFRAKQLLNHRVLRTNLPAVNLLQKFPRPQDLLHDATDSYC